MISFVNSSVKVLPFPFELIYVSSIRQLVPIFLIRFLKFLSIKGVNLNTHLFKVA